MSMKLDTAEKIAEALIKSGKIIIEVSASELPSSEAAKPDEASRDAIIDRFAYLLMQKVNNYASPTIQKSVLSYIIRGTIEEMREELTD